ncbi:hypothetical protein EPUS_09243 [Endocarpon pusillum Z07020]|uniref:Uncharacterized protein n=1 Tax=Endocarpon pusillum (strain Z07020 / HMAS-L-300199) TaxID=1263415 RepID=U1FWU9_ENDPU|nr:uncharacterized protein EPUS_09243 [Endocarpon pusillum Z07020]ERF69337.1 hypothetical protein EPUS_09243 [Endocarpon pusillum Z07020]
MHASLDEWERQLQIEFLPNQGEAATRARQLRFKFENAEELSLASYLRRKAQLLRDAGVADESSIKFEVWQGLDPEIKSITPLRNNETLAQFVSRVRENDSAASFTWKTKNRGKDRSRSDKFTTKAPFHTQQRYERVEPRSSRYEPEYKREDRRPIEPTRDSRRTTRVEDPKQEKKAPVNMKREPRRPCRHCNGNHWDNECPKAKANLARRQEFEDSDTDMDEAVDAETDDEADFMAMRDLGSTDSESEN